eukprot:COSAG05_NODE_8932_length_660_cov_1.035651_2_plen_22_part_01
MIQHTLRIAKYSIWFLRSILDH